VHVLRFEWLIPLACLSVRARATCNSRIVSGVTVDACRCPGPSVSRSVVH
jgi:hypothetical protein